MRGLTNIQKECYDRNCICLGCEYKQYVSSRGCLVKKSIIEYVTKNGMPIDIKQKGILNE